jgi:hypothetical protein
MKNVTAFNVLSKQVAAHACSLIKIDGEYRSATACWIQLHDSAGTAAEGAEPVKSWPIAGGTDANPQPFFQTFVASPLEFVNGLYICVSTTDATKTISAADKMDLSVEIVRADNSTTVVGDTTTGVTGLQVWSEATGTATPRRLVRVDVAGPVAASWLMGFTVDSPAEGATPEFQVSLGSAGASKAVTFGDDGRVMKSGVTSALKQGCTLKISSTAGVLTTTVATGTIRAEYKTL